MPVAFNWEDRTFEKRLLNDHHVQRVYREICKLWVPDVLLAESMVADIKYLRMEFKFLSDPTYPGLYNDVLSVLEHEIQEGTHMYK